MPNSLMPMAIQLGFAGIIGILFWLIVVRWMNHEKALRKSPFTKSLLRSAGESCLKKMDDLTDDLWIWFAATFSIFTFISGLGMGLFQPQFKSPVLAAPLGILLLAMSIYAIVRVRRVLRERMNYRLGFEGERQTAQALQPLLAEGYELFHDLEFKDASGKPFNIDHVLLGPAGVIVIETKTRSKEAAGKGPEAATVRYDGKQILYPKGPETHGLNQAIANAKFLARELTSHTGEKVFVRAALSLPGWYVTQTVREANPIVRNPEMLRSWVLELPTSSMPTAQRNRIRGFLAKTNITPN